MKNIKFIQPLLNKFRANEFNSSLERCDEILREAKRLGVDDKSLTTSSGGISTNHYETLLRVQTEKSFKMLAAAQKYVIISSIAAIISALAALYAVNC